MDHGWLDQIAKGPMKMPATDRMQEPDRSMKLDSEDYENIYLRVREKLWLFWAGMFTVLGGVGLIMAYITINTAAKDIVERYMRSEGFEKALAEQTSKKIADLEAREMKLQASLAKLERRASVAQNLPISVTDNGLTVLSADGRKFFIETGVARGGTTVQFTSQFKNPPFVAVGPVRDSNPTPLPPSPLYPQNMLEVTLHVATSEGFRVPPPQRLFPYYSWIAIGH